MHDRHRGGVVSLPSTLDTRLCDLLGCRYPIVQTGMGWVSVPELVAATCNAGGFGILAGATLRPDELEPAILRVKELTDAPFGVNFVMEQPNVEQVVDAIIRHGVRAAGYHRSPRMDLVERMKSAGVVCMPTAGARRHAEKAVEMGADALIVQGGEGGGHTGPVSTLLLVPDVVEAVDVPVAAAGGFRDGAGLVAALALGADGIAMGTRFLMTSESPVQPRAKDRYADATVFDTVVTRRVDGLPQRLLINELAEQLESENSIVGYWRAIRSAMAYRSITGASVSDLLRAGLRMRKSGRLNRRQVIMAANAAILVREGLLSGDPSEGILPTGQVAGLISDQPTCAELIDRIVSEAEICLAGLCGNSNQ